MEQTLSRLKAIDREIQLLTHTSALLGWDQETYMPSRAIKERAEQQSLLAGLIHDRLINPDIEGLFAACGVTDENPKGHESLSEQDRAFLRLFHRHYTRESKIPKELVVELSRQASLSQAKWIEARSKSDFAIFSPYLKKILDLTRQKAEKIGYKDHPYDALLDEFEPWMTSREVSEVFSDLKKRLQTLVRKIAASKQVDESFLLKDFPVYKQDEFGRAVLKDMGYDFERGRMDISAHPFTTGPGADDIRITTRYQADFFKTGLFGTIHECGHALYELGFKDEIKGTLLASGTSLGLHESQSRTWENLIGRSLSFWKHYYPKLKTSFPEQLKDISLEEFYRGVNRVEPTMIRVEADEVTYSLHIILRFELELALLTGELKVDDLPEAWNAKMEEFLGICPENDAEGVLQDIHWSFGAIGYFPTYSLGNLYGAQFYRTMKRDLGDIDDILAKGNLGSILSWLRKNIHQHGSIYTARELCEKVTGEPLSADYFISYLEEKYQGIYHY